MRLLTFLIALVFAPLAMADEPAVSAMAGDLSIVVACDTAEQVDSIIAGIQESPVAGRAAFEALSRPGTGIFGDEPACILSDGIIKVTVVAAEPRGPIQIGDGMVDAWVVTVERAYEQHSIRFYVLWTSDTSIRYGPTA